MNIIDKAVPIIAEVLDEYSIERAQTIVRQYLTRIDAPDNLQHIDHVTKEMKKVIDVLKTVGEQEDKETLECWEVINQAIDAKSIALQECGVKLLLSKEKQDGNKNDRKTHTSDIEDKGSLHGKKQKHPLYAILWHIEDKESYPQQYVMLKSVMFRIWERITYKSSNDYAYKCSLYVRIVGEEKNKEILRLLPAQPQTVDAYLKSLEMILGEVK